MVLLFYSLLLPCVLVPTAAASLEHYCTYVVVYFLSSYPYYPTTMATSNSLTNQLLVTVGLLADCLVIGAPVWVFFLQSPALFAFMGRSKFIPPMMRLTKVLFHWTLPVATAVALGTSLLTDCTPTKYATPWALLSAAAVAVNSLVVVPRALAAGAKATTTTANSSSTSKTTKMGSKTADFAVSGGDGNNKSVTRTLHQTVVVLVVVMLVCAVGHLHFSVHSECRR
jgi:hypothetical protein